MCAGLFSAMAVFGCGRIGYAPFSTALCSGIAGGTHDETRLNSRQGIELADATSGAYTSVVCDVGPGFAPKLLQAVPRAPYQKPIPIQSESGYSEANVDTFALASLWRLNLDSSAGLGAAVVDATGLGYTGTVVGSGVGEAIQPAQGLFGQAANFDGLGGHRIDFGDVDALDFGVNSFSFGVWVFVEQTAGDHDIPIYKGGSSASTAGYDIELGDGNWNGRISDGTVTSALRFGFLNDFQGAWTHLFVVVDRQSQEMHVYANGNRIDTGSIAAVGSVSSSRQLTIGSHDNTMHQFWGRIEEVSIWRRALSAAEVDNLYRRGALAIRYQVRTCSTPDCAEDGPFIGPDGTSATFYSERTNETGGMPVFDLTQNPSLTANRYFQWKAFFQTADIDISPELSGMIVELN